MNIRQDAWLEQDDLTLADTVLKHIRNGSTQLAAFEETAELLNRTPAACGFRWNSEVRKGYEQEIKEAKTLRKLGKKNRTTDEPLVEVSNVTKEQTGSNIDFSDKIVAVAKAVKNQIANMTKQIKTLSDDLQAAKNRIAELEEQLSGQSPEKAVTEDYETLMQILQRARDIGLLEQRKSS
jgi:prespore-specific regulator